VKKASAASKPKPDKIIPASTEAILESISDGVFTVGLDWKITSFNKAAEIITGISRKDAIGKPCCDVFHSSMCSDECPLRSTLQNSKPIISKSGYIVDIDGNRIPISVSTAVLRDGKGGVIGGAETFRDLSEIEDLRRELEGRSKVGDLSSRSSLMQKIFEILPAIASSPSTVLINGETGTGKEIVARTIHDLSPRSKGPFIAVNCGALPENLLESELFGFKQGAFTGAAKDKPGRFALAKGGTIFLDEIGEIAPALQVKLLRVLQERVFEPLGSVRSEPADVRIIAATNKNLSHLINTGAFREDLYYRINVVRIELPPLRRRKEDIPLLINEFISRFNRLHKKTITSIASDALSLLMAHDWPGNIRELENIIERCFIMCEGDIIGIQHLPAELITYEARNSSASQIKLARENVDLHVIREALERHGYNRGAAARELGIHKTTFFRLVRKLGISLPKKDGRSHRSRNVTEKKRVLQRL
jgi:PAS domain S-box-containing protein